ncbi:MAG: SIS domain-containing protein [Ardenticatenaceae bacterium]|nr:SIS domain-containing protein [Ardenticatenaceae bacterium]MCB9444855.1 SIS domain-containing protein [Ardenticatenaceae bacterium]
MIRSPLHQQVDTLPELVRAMIDPLVRVIQLELPEAVCRQVQRVFLTGCGDSHHAVLNAELAFEQLAGLPCEPMTALQMGRYTAQFLPDTGRGTNLLLAVSVSGAVSRTIEALTLVRQTGAVGVAVTGSASSPLAQAAEIVLTTPALSGVEVAVPPLPDELQGMIVPGTRSYIASQLALYLTAIHLGQIRGRLSKKEANQLRHELADMADLMEQTIAASDPAARRLAQDWLNADQFVFCGAGPNYGTALFSAAKVLEASGDTAVAQDTEEWAHLQYFARQIATPTIIISAGGQDESRALEIATAAHHIGRRVAIIAPTGSQLTQTRDKDALLPIAGPVREAFSPLLTCLPGVLFAAYRAQAIGEPYFRDFGGGRSIEGGGGISRIRDSKMIERAKRDT